MERIDNIYIFSKSRFELYFVRYVALFGAIITILALEVVWIYNNNPQDIKILIFVIIVFFIIHIGGFMLSNKFVFSIVANTDKKIMTFQMFKRNKSFEVLIADLEKIYVNFYVTFYFKGKKVLYRGVEEKKLITFLKKSEKVVWGFAWKWISGKQ